MLFSLVDNPRFRPLIERYVASFGELIPELHGHFDAARMHPLRTLVHRLRGTASNYGFPEISQAAGRCEDQIRSEAQPAQIEQALGDLVGLMQDALDSRRRG